jgi:hypothetical protein
MSKNKTKMKVLMTLLPTYIQAVSPGKKKKNATNTRI